MYLEDIKCDCGNPACDGEIFARVGPVFRGDTREGGYLHFETYVGVGEDRKYHELMINPEDAREMAWWFAWNYLPVFRHISRIKSWFYRWWIYFETSWLD